MSEKHTIASRARWADITPEERSKRMSAVAISRHSKLSKKQRHENAMKMVRARKAKLTSNKNKG